jgi:hypothetical protein
VTVPTGAFVARANGKAFITGNSGFPKSANVSKMIDAAAGAEREVVGRRTDRAATPKMDIRGGKYIGGINGAIDCSAITVPATEEAKTWDGFGTALKPASEHWLLVRKPLAEKTIAANVLKWGVGAINVDACRIEGVKPVMVRTSTVVNARSTENPTTGATSTGEMTNIGRWPANVILSHQPSCNGVCEPGCAVAELDAQSGTLTSGKPSGNRNSASNMQAAATITPLTGFGDTGGASRFFATFKYCAKPSKAEKNAGANNIHSTVKPKALMCYLLRLVTPSGGTVLEPFMGSGTTIVAAIEEGFDYIGIEREPEYFAIAQGREAHALGKSRPFAAPPVVSAPVAASKQDTMPSLFDWVRMST